MCAFRPSTKKRSTFVAAHEGWLEFRCSMGKSRRKGTRPPYNWALPDVSLWGFSLKAVLEDYFVNTHLPEMPFLMPAPELTSDELWQLTEHTSLCLTRKLSPTRFLDIFRGLLIRADVPIPAARCALFNRLRRFMPTGSQVYNLSDQEAQAVGSWVELPFAQSRATGSGKPASKSTAMSIHYAGGKAATAYQAKAKILQQLMQAFRRVAKDMSASASASMLPADGLTWGEISQGRAQSENERPQGASTSCEASSSSASSSSGEESSQSTADVLPDAHAIVDVSWFTQKNKRHVVRERDADMRLLPWCRAQPFPQDPAERGQGIPDCHANAWCAKCLKCMPRELAASISEVCK